MSIHTSCNQRLRRRATLHRGVTLIELASALVAASLVGSLGLNQFATTMRRMELREHTRAAHEALSSPKTEMVRIGARSACITVDVTSKVATVVYYESMPKNDTCQRPTTAVFMKTELIALPLSLASIGTSVYGGNLHTPVATFAAQYGFERQANGAIYATPTGNADVPTGVVGADSYLGQVLPVRLHFSVEQPIEGMQSIVDESLGQTLVKTTIFAAGATPDADGVHLFDGETSAVVGLY